MVVIRLTRGGAKKRPFYHIVAAHKQSRRDGQFIERLGYYNPIAAGNETPLMVAVDRVDLWKQRGATLSPTVARLVKQYAAASPATAQPAAAEPAAA
jgi:small subunit ribosomal protein S16